MNEHIKDVNLQTKNRVLLQLFELFKRAKSFHNDPPGSSPKKQLEISGRRAKSMIYRHKDFFTKKKKILVAMDTYYAIEAPQFTVSKIHSETTDVDMRFEATLQFHNFICSIKRALGVVMSPPGWKSFEGNKRQKSPPMKAYEFHNIHNRELGWNKR